MNKKEKTFLLIADLVMLCLAIYPIFLGGVVGGYDPGFHMGRIQALATNIASGHFPNPIGFEYLDKFGYGVGFFYGNFFLYPFAILNALGMTIYHTYLIYIIVFVALNIFSINFVVQKLFHNNWATILSAPIYLSSYYLYGIIYMRAAAGELVALAIIPWILLSAFKMVKGETKYWLMLAISFGLLFVTHILSFLIAAAAVILIFIINLIPIFKNKKVFWSFIKAALLFLGLTSCFSLSFIQQYTAQKYIDTARDANGNYGILLNSSLMKNHIFDTSQFTALNGTFLVILLLLALVFYLYKGRGFHFQNKVIPQSFILIILLSSLTLSTDALKLAVKIFKPLILLQVIGRFDVILLPLMTFVIADAFGQLLNHSRKFKLPLAALFVIITAVITVVFPIKNNLNFVANRKGPIAPFSVSMGEYEPQAFMDFNVANNFKVNTNFLENTENYHVTTNNHFKAVVAVKNRQKSRTVILPRIYYKGYQVKTIYNGKSKITPTITKHGLVATKLPTNFKSGKIEVTYHMTTAAKVGWVISILSLLILIWIFFKEFNARKSQTK